MNKRQKEKMRHDSVASIAVVDLASQLKQHNIIDTHDIKQLHPLLDKYLLTLERNEDVSFLFEKRLPESILIKLWRLADADPIVKDIGPRIGATISNRSLGLLSALLRQCDTLREVLEVYLQNIAVLNASESWRTKEVGGTKELIFSFQNNKEYPQCAVERSMVAIHQFSQFFCQKTIPLIRVEFEFAKPTYHQTLQSLFACNIRYQSSCNKLLVDDDVFSFPIPTRSTYMKNVLKEKVNSLNTLYESNIFQGKVRELLRTNLSQYCHVDELCNALYLSRATLYRKLRIEGTGFSKLLDEERRVLFTKYKDSSPDKLCEMLGFSDPSSLYKAIKRWEKRES